MIEDRYNLTGQTAIVTGASRGIGAMCAYTLAKYRANVALIDLLPADEIIQKIKTAFPDSDVTSFQTDIRKRQDVQQVIADIVNRWGRIDILVNNAGTCGRIGLEEMTDEQWSRDLDTNLGGTFLFTQLAIYPHMVGQQYGKIVNISSIAGIMGGPTSNYEGKDSGRSGPAYAASKGAIIAFTKWVAKEVGPYGITCNSVAPGSVQTEMTKGLHYSTDNQPIKRIGVPEDIAEAVAYLASPASNYVTGQVIKVCGGLAIG